MYAGVFTLNKGNFFHCEEQECTAPVPGWLVFVFLVIELKVVYWPYSDCFHWTRLKVPRFRFGRSYWISQFSRASYDLTFGYLHVASPWYSSMEVD